MKKILLASLASITALFLWQYFVSAENKASPATPAALLEKIDNNKTKFARALNPSFEPIKTNNIDSSRTVPQISETREKPVSLNAPVDGSFQAQILSLLAETEGNEALDAVALSWKAGSCPECVDSLKQIIRNDSLNKDLRTKAALVLAKIGTQQSVVALIESFYEYFAIASETRVLQKIASKSISAIYEPEGVAALAAMLTGQQEGLAANQLPSSLVKTMTKAIAFYADKNSLAYELTKQYWATQNPEVQNAIIELNHPQTLALLAMDARESGDFSLQNSVMEKLAENGQSESLDALMTLAKNSNQDTELQTQINEWTQAHINTDRQGHLIDYLSNPEASAEQREIAAQSLENIIQIPELVSQQDYVEIQTALNKLGESH